MKSGLPIWPFGVIVEPGSENVLDVFRVTCHGEQPLLASQERKSECTCLVRGGTARGTEVTRDPVVD